MSYESKINLDLSIVLIFLQILIKEIGGQDNKNDNRNGQNFSSISFFKTIGVRALKTI